MIQGDRDDFVAARLKLSIRQIGGQELRPRIAAAVSVSPIAKRLGGYRLHRLGRRLRADDGRTGR